MYLSIDIGGTNTRIASSKSLNNLVLERKLYWTDEHNKNDIKSLIIAIKKFEANVDAIGIGITGDLNNEKTLVNQTRWNHEWEGVPIVEMLKNEFNCPVFMDNDAVVASLGVALFGEGKNQEFIYLTWGTGIGGAIVSHRNDKLVSEKLDWFKYFQAWEKKCGGKRLEERYGKKTANLSDEEWREVINDFLFELNKFSNEFNLPKIILGGGISFKKQKELHDLNLNITILQENASLFGGFGLLGVKLGNKS